ncbi:hypothetical protein DERF_006100 [Dermatophagoides farinae]|uniref:Uncharacterized protein n=1 Tax=Dermatophagoides farinae TaxID=6954 RepID=A0A922L6V1_DERFA|nr:hypothetical protein DERF_006100 [Dermatophagoides farinae]
MPQCLSPIDLDTKSPAILEFLHHHHHHHHHNHRVTDDSSNEISSLQNHHYPYHQMFTTIDSPSLDPSMNEFDYFYGQTSNIQTSSTSSSTATITPTIGSCFYPYSKKSLNKTGNRMINRSDLSCHHNHHNRQTPIDDYVYLEFFVDSIKPEYSSSSLSNDLITYQSSSLSPSTASSISTTLDNPPTNFSSSSSSSSSPLSNGTHICLIVDEYSVRIFMVRT